MLFWEIVRSIFRTRSRFHPSVPKEALCQESQKDSLDEPEVAIGPCRDAIRAAIRRQDRELGQFVIVSRADAPDVVATELSEPEVTIGPSRDASRLALGRRDRELGDHACRGDAPDLVSRHRGLGEPEGT